MKVVSVIGAGNWGATLAVLLANNGYRVRLWEKSAALLQTLKQTRQHPRLPASVILPESIELFSDINAEFLEQSAFIVIAIVSHAIVDVLSLLKQTGLVLPPLVIATKGMQNAVFWEDVLQTQFSAPPDFALLSGPSFAKEVAIGIDTTVVFASKNIALQQIIPPFFQTEHFHVEFSHDVVGVQLCGTMKNVIAIASGISAGCGLGDNYRACLLVQGLQEMCTLGRVLGASTETFYGIAGFGDLCLTAHSQQSRNFRFGYSLGTGDSAAQARANIGEAIEGIDAAADIYLLAKKHGVLLPICNRVYEKIYP